MHILHIGKYYPPFPGGIENFMGALLPHLASNDAQVGALVHHHLKGKAFSSQLLDNVHIYRTPTYGKLLFTPLSPLFPFHLNKVIKEFKPDLLHIHMPNVSAFWVLLLKSCRDIPIVIHWHSDVVASHLQNRLALAYRFYRPFEQSLLQRSTAIIATSPSYLASSIPLHPWKKKCHIIPLGLSALEQTDQKIEQVISTLWSDSKALKVLCVGRLTYYKGHEFLIKAIAALDGLQCIIVGEGDERLKLQKLIDKLDAENKVSLIGSASDDELAQLMQSCDCLCLPSIERTEAFGLVLLEEMRLGKPVIATDVAGSGMSWVVQDGITGLVAKAADVPGMQSAIATLRNDESRRNSMGAAGRERFLEQFTIKQVAEQTLDLYRQTLNQHRE